MVARSAWMDPVGVIALPAPHEGWFWVAYIGNEHPHEQLVDEVEMDYLPEYAAEFGAGRLPSFSAPSIPYLKNPWMVLGQLSERSGAGLDFVLPDWFDKRPMDEFRARYPAEG